MNAVKEDVINLVDKELQSANERFPLFRSDHKGYAIIKEETEEAQEELTWCVEKLGCIWELIKQNNETWQEAEFLKEFAINGAVEMIQIAAMAKKLIDSQKGRANENLHSRADNRDI